MSRHSPEPGFAGTDASIECLHDLSCTVKAAVQAFNGGCLPIKLFDFVACLQDLLLASCLQDCVLGKCR